MGLIVRVKMGPYEANKSFRTAIRMMDTSETITCIVARH
jgi:hypothetical protein